MRNLKRVWSLLLALVLALGLCTTAFAAVEDTGFSDVPADAWYADAAVYCREHGVMNGTSATTFGPNTTMSRAMLAAVLYRAAGSPQVTTPANFRDVAASAYYYDAASWAAANGIISGYGNGLFGSNDPVTREQIATILWRYEGSPAPAGTSQTFADQASIASYAVNAVAWARENGIISGMSGNRFAPKNNATRAQVATILMNYLQDDTVTPAPDPEPTPDEGGKILVAYFSATGNTENIANHLDAVLDADLYEIVPQEPYTSADLNYSSSNSRAEQEINDPNARPAISGSVENMEDYDVIFLGYPIWWGQAPKVIYTFLESYDLDGKTIVPFCTSASSGMGSSATNMHALAPDANWLSGQRFSGSASQSTVANWVDGLDLPETVADASSDASASTRIRLAFDGKEAIVSLEDNATTRDFLSMLPQTLTFEDYAGSEKISYLPRSLSTEGAPSTYDPAVGDLILYAPWGNLAVFYRDAGRSSGPVPMGHVESGLDLLTAMDGEFEVTVSVAA